MVRWAQGAGQVFHSQTRSSSWVHQLPLLPPTALSVGLSSENSCPPNAFTFALGAQGFMLPLLGKTGATVTGKAQADQSFILLPSTISARGAGQRMPLWT